MIPVSRPLSRRASRAPGPHRSRGRTVAGRYRLLDQVGAGGMGSVWRSRDLTTGGEVAVKVLGRHDPSLLLRFVREQGVRIEHPHVVRHRGWAADDDLVALAMDLVRGGTAGDLLARHGPLPQEYVAVLLDQLLQALGTVHAAGLVHRDVKPDNLLLEPTGAGRPHLRLADFGVAVPLAEVRLTRGPGLVGTEGYLPPEHVAGAPPDPRQDLYAAGVVAEQLLTGREPSGRGPTRPAPSSRLRPLLAALTADDPDHRPSSAGEALVWLRRLGVPAGVPWAGETAPYVGDRFCVGGRAARGAPGARDRSGWRGRPYALAALGCFTASLGCATGSALLLV